MLSFFNKLGAIQLTDLIGSVNNENDKLSLFFATQDVEPSSKVLNSH